MKDLLLHDLTQFGFLRLVKAGSLGLNEPRGHQEEKNGSEVLVHLEVVVVVVVVVVNVVVVVVEVV